MLPKHIDPWIISMELEMGNRPAVIADRTGESLDMLIHHLAVNGCPDLATRLANTKPQRRQHA